MCVCVCMCVLCVKTGRLKTNGDEQDQTEGKKVEKGVTRLIEGQE